MKKTVKEILRMEDISPEDRVWEVVQLLPEVENRKFAIWCARRANQNNIPAVAKYLDAAEAFYVFGTLTKTEFDECRAEFCAGWEAAAANPEEWLTDCAAYRSSDWGAYKFPKWAAYNASYWAAKYEVADWAAQIEYFKTAIKQQESKNGN